MLFYVLLSKLIFVQFERSPTRRCGSDWLIIVFEISIIQIIKKFKFLIS